MFSLICCSFIYSPQIYLLVLFFCKEIGNMCAHIGHCDDSEIFGSLRKLFLTNSPFSHVCFHFIFTRCHNFTFVHASQNRFSAVLFCNPKTDLRMTGRKIILVILSLPTFLSPQKVAEECSASAKQTSGNLWSLLLIYWFNWSYFDQDKLSLLLLK